MARSPGSEPPHHSDRHHFVIRSFLAGEGIRRVGYFLEPNRIRGARCGWGQPRSGPEHYSRND